MIQIKRVYDQVERTDGYRILVDRLWPRGLTKKDAKVDLWLKEIAPSNELRKWFGHEREKWPMFKKRYLQELHEKKELLDQIRILEKEFHAITLLYSATDTSHNQAVILCELLEY